MALSTIVLVNLFLCNKLPRIQQFKTADIYHLMRFLRVKNSAGGFESSSPESVV